jgi:hypothetical protein
MAGPDTSSVALLGRDGEMRRRGDAPVPGVALGRAVVIGISKLNLRFDLI